MFRQSIIACPLGQAADFLYEWTINVGLLIEAVNQTGRICSLEKWLLMHYLANHTTVHPSTTRRI